MIGRRQTLSGAIFYFNHIKNNLKKKISFYLGRRKTNPEVFLTELNENKLNENKKNKSFAFEAQKR